MDTNDICIRIRPNVHHTTVEDTCVIVNMDTGEYLGLDFVGTRIWQLILQGSTAVAIVRVLHDEFGVTEQTLRSDLDAFLRECKGQRLLDLVPLEPDIGAEVGQQ